MWRSWTSVKCNLDCYLSSVSMAHLSHMAVLKLGSNSALQCSDAPPSSPLPAAGDDSETLLKPCSAQLYDAEAGRFQEWVPSASFLPVCVQLLRLS